MILQLIEVIERQGRNPRTAETLVDLTGVAIRGRRQPEESGSLLLFSSGDEMKVTDSLIDIRSQIRSGGVEGNP